MVGGCRKLAFSPPFSSSPGMYILPAAFPGRLNATEFMGGNKARKRRFEHRFAKSEFQAIFPNVKSPNEATLFVGL